MMNLTEQLEQVKQNILAQTKSGDALLDGSFDYLAATGGKMLRPSLLLIGSRLGKSYEASKEKLIDLATVVETIHLATLIHDDIIDEAKIRRGKPSIHAKYGQSYAVYMGDYLLSRCFLMVVDLDIDREIGKVLANTVSRLCIGDMTQNQMRYSLEMTPRKYVRIVSGKTAALFSASLSAGAQYTGAERDTVIQLAKIGYAVGMAFQLIDDLLDYNGDAAIIGKEVHTDVLKGYYSMPVIYCLNDDSRESTELRALLSRGADNESIDRIYEIVRNSGALDRTKALALKYSKRAMKWIGQLPEGDTRDMLNELVPKLLSRIS